MYLRSGHPPNPAGEGYNAAYRRLASVEGLAAQEPHPYSRPFGFYAVRS